MTSVSHHRRVRAEYQGGIAGRSVANNTAPTRTRHPKSVRGDAMESPTLDHATCMLCVEAVSSADRARLPCCQVCVCKECLKTWLRTCLSRGVALSCPSGTCGKLPVGALEVGVACLLMFSAPCLARCDC